MNELQVGRDTLLFMPAWAVVLFYVLTAVTVAFFTWGNVRMLRRYRQGRREVRMRVGPVVFLRAALRALGNVTVLRDDRFAGIAHLLVLSGFAVLFVGTLIVLVDRDILQFVLPSWVFWEGDFYLGFSLLMDVFGVLLIVGLLMMALRRGFFGLPQLQYPARFRTEASRKSLVAGDWLFLGLILFIVVGGFLIEGARLVMDRPGFERWSPVGWWLSDVLQSAGMGPAEAAVFYPFAWWLHSVASMALVATLPWTKSAHMLLGTVSLAWYDDSLARNLPAAADGEAAGYEHWTDMTWNELLSLDTCIRCGRCHVRCPSAEEQLPLSPREVILDLRDHVRSVSMHHPSRNGNGNGSGMGSAEGGNGHPKKLGEIIPVETLWSCISCFNCASHCPVGVNHVPLMVQLRRAAVNRGDVDEQLQQTLINLQRTGNAMGKSDRLRAKWSADLPFKIRDARKEPVEWLWFVGDNASYDPRVQESTRRLAGLFQDAELDYGILYEAERNAGNDVRRVGEEGLYEMLVEKNLAAFERATFTGIVTSDPHSYNTLKNEYPSFGAEYPVLHATELLLQLLRNGQLAVASRTGGRVTYHDPCYLARYNGLTEAPRQLLRAVGMDVVEMPRRGRDAWCCGAGGGRLWMEDIPADGQRPAEQRIREAAALEGVDTIVTACPKDVVMFTDAIKSMGLEGRFFVRDIADVLWEAIEHPMLEYNEKEA
jgi:Fe-S oxidoreductase/nitrate reductase gamma subunit